MQKIIGVTDLQRRFRTVFDEVTKQRIPYVLTRGSRPEAVLMPYEEYERYQLWQEQEALALFDSLMERLAKQNAQFEDDEIAADVTAAQAEARS